MWLAWALGATIVIAYGFSLWWWAVRDEAPWVRTALVALCSVALVLRLVYTTDYPAGLNQDEPKNLSCSMRAIERGEMFAMACNGVPYLLSALFAAPLVPLVGFNRWAMRSYALALSVLAPAAGYAVGRAMALDAISSLVVGGLLAVLPWSILYGRVSLGGELVFHQLLLLAALARLIWRDTAGWREALLGAGALCLLLYDYYAGRAMLAMPLVAAMLAAGGVRRRGWCLMVLALACVGWLPYWRSGPQHDAVIVRALLGWQHPGEATIVHPDFAARPLMTLWVRTQLALRVFVEPVAQLSIWAIPTAALHPLGVLLVAGAGVLLTSMRRKLFMLAGFVVGLLPAVLSDQFSVSTHRMLMAFPFVALAAGAAVAALPWRGLRAASAAILLTAATVASVRLYFSPTFWTPDARAAFDADRTAVLEHLPDPMPAHVIVSEDMRQFGFLPPPTTIVEPLSLANWWPPVAATYVFPPTAELLAPFYHQLFPGRVQQFGQAFLVSVDGRSLGTALGPYGWQHTVVCDGVVAHAGVVPAVFTLAIGPVHPACGRARAVTYVWKGHWEGPETTMRLDFTGKAAVAVDQHVAVTQAGYEQRAPFTVPHATDVTIAIVATSSGPRATLVEVLPDGVRLPSAEHVLPR